MPAVLFILHSEHMCRKMAVLNGLGTGSGMLFASLIASQIRGPMRRQSLLKPYCLHAASVVRFALDPNALRFDPASREFFHKHERAAFLPAKCKRQEITLNLLKKGGPKTFMI